MSNMQFLMAFFGIAFFTLLIELGAVSDGDCKYNAKKIKAETMECYLIMGDRVPVCKAGGSSSEHCRIEIRGQEMCIKWLKSSDIRCQNETHLEEMEGTSQDCAADQASLDCTKEFSTGLDKDATIAASPGPQNSTPTNKAGVMESSTTPFTRPQSLSPLRPEETAGTCTVW